MEVENSIQISKEEESKNIEQLKGSFDTAIVVLQGGIEEGYNGTAKIPKTARMREYAGIFAYNQSLEEGKSPVIILSGGAQVDDRNGSWSEASLMKRYMVEEYGVEDWRVIEEDLSIDTSTNAIQCSKILEKLGFLEKGEVKLITNEFHLDRSKMLFKRYYKGEVQPVAAENILIDSGDRSKLPGDSFPRRYGGYANAFLRSNEHKDLSKKDRLLFLIYSTAIGTKLFKIIAEKTREKKIYS